MACALTACHTEDYGSRYAEGEIDFPDDLYSVSAVGEGHLWAGGYFGAIFRTTDGGRSWNKLQSTTEKSINDVSFADEQHGWAVGRRGFVIYTSDGGATWERQRVPREPAQHLFAIHALSPTEAWAVGDWGGRYYTSDAGKTWEDRSFLLHRLHPAFKYLTDEELEVFERGDKVYDDMFLNDVYFQDRQHGWIVGEYGFIFYTHDAGETWTKAEIQGDVKFDPVYFPAGSERVPKDRWNDIFDMAEVLNDKPYLRVRADCFLTQAEFNAGGDTFLADERFDEIRGFLDSEGITQDRIRNLNPTPYTFEGINREEFEEGRIGEPLCNVTVIETPFLFDVKFKGLEKGLVAGLGGVVLRSQDGGATWRYVETDSRQALFAAAFGTEDRLIAIGEKGQRRISPDGGETWTILGDPEEGYGTFKTAGPVFGFMRDMAFGTEQHGWIVGQGGLVMRTENGGKDWFQVLPLYVDPESGQVQASEAGE